MRSDFWPSPGELEMLLMLLGRSSVPGTEVRRMVSERTGKPFLSLAPYSVLRRLEEAELVHSTIELGGSHRVKYFELTALGEEVAGVLKQFDDIRQRQCR